MKNQFQKKFIGLAFTLILISANTFAQIDPALAAQLQLIVNNRVQINGNNGVSACVIMPNGDTWKGTAGVGVGNVPISDSTVYHGASTMKTTIATLILLLAENGLLNLDSSWHHYVNLNVNFDTTITIRQLLSHTSGIADYLEMAATPGYVTTDFTRAFTPVEILEDIVDSVPDFAPGTNFSYSSSNYTLLAYIAETITGNPVQQELRTRIWNPFGMTHTYFGGFESYSEPRAGVWWNFGSGIHNYSNDPETSMLTYAYGGGNIVSTPADLAHFARELFSGHILSPASMNEMQTFIPASYASWCAGYGLGIHNASSFGNNTVLGHDGYYTNMTDMFHSFDYGFTLVTMTNRQTAWFAIFDQMYNAIKNHLLTGIHENSASLSIDLFPNPTENSFAIDLSSVNKHIEIFITDITGKTIYTTVSESPQLLEVDTKDFAKGVYAVQIQTTDFLITKKFIVTK